MNSADDYIKKYQRNAVHPDTAFLCPEDQVREIEYRNQEELTAHIEAVFLDPHRPEPFSIHHVTLMHRITVQGLYDSAGQLRRGAETVHIPGASFEPSLGTDVERDLRDLLDDIRKIAENPAPPGECILHAAHCFHRFLVIHPFLDGNGRVGRGLLHLMLYEFKVLAPPEQIYDYTESERSQYYDTLERADRGDIFPLAWFITDAVLDTGLQAFYDSVRISSLADHILARLTSDQRRFMNRAHRRWRSRDSRVKIANVLNKRIRRILDDLKT